MARTLGGVASNQNILQGMRRTAKALAAPTREIPQVSALRFTSWYPADLRLKSRPCVEDNGAYRPVEGIVVGDRDLIAAHRDVHGKGRIWLTTPE